MWSMQRVLPTFRSFFLVPSQIRCVETISEQYDSKKVPSLPKPAEKAPEGQGCPLCRAGLQNFGYRDVLLLRQFLTPAGLLIGRRQSGVCRKSQGRLTKAIRRSRAMGLLPNFRLQKQRKETTSKQPQS